MNKGNRFVLRRSTLGGWKVVDRKYDSYEYFLTRKEARGEAKVRNNNFDWDQDAVQIEDPD
jgi:hypothetical protein